MKNYRFKLKYGTIDDFFLPSRDEMYEMLTVLHGSGLGGFTGAGYWTSSQGSASNAYLIYRTDPTKGDQEAKSAAINARLCRTFPGTAKDFPLRSLGITGGYIFLHANGLVYESAPVDQSASVVWSNVSSTAVTGTGTAVGTGAANTALIIGQAGHTTSAANLSTTYTLPEGLILRHAPAGWDEKTITFSRHEYYHSVLRSYSLNLRFVFEAVPFIKAAYEAEGINAVITIEIESLDRTDFTYGNFYSGVLDLSEMKQFPDWIECPIIDNDTLSRFISRDEIEIEMNASETIDGITMEEYDMLLPAEIKGVNIEQHITYSGDGHQITGSAIGFKTFGVTDKGPDLNEIGEIANIRPVIFNPDRVYLYDNTSDKTVNVRVSISVKYVGQWIVQDGTVYDISFVIRLATSPSTEVNIISFASADTAIGILTLNDSATGTYNGTIAVPAGEHIELVCESDIDFPIGPGGVSHDITVYDWVIDAAELTPAAIDTVVNVALPHELFSRAIEIMTNNTQGIDSDVLGRTDSEPATYDADGAGSLTAIVSGLMLRGKRFETYPLKIKFRELFKSFSNIYNLGLWYNGTQFEIKKIEEYYKEEEIASLGEVKDLEISTAKEKYFNELTAGYSGGISHERITAIIAHNVAFTWVNSIFRVKNALDISVPYYADDYSIELARKERNRRDTKGNIKERNTTYDLNNFVLQLERDGSALQTTQGTTGFTAVTGIYDVNSRLNLDLTPKRNLLRCGNRVSVAETYTENDYKTISNASNKTLVTTKSGESAVNEKANIEFSDLDSPLYEPVYYNFSAPVTMVIMQAIMSDPHGYFKFTFNGVTYGGFIHEVSTEPFQRQGNFTLLKVPFEI